MIDRPSGPWHPAVGGPEGGGAEGPRAYLQALAQEPADRREGQEDDVQRNGQE